MSATIAYNADLFLSSTATEAVSAAPELDTTPAKPGFFTRVLEAIGQSYYIKTADGHAIYIYPPC